MALAIDFVGNQPEISVSKSPTQLPGPIGTLTQGVMIQAHPQNTDPIFFGPSTMTAASGIVLTPGSVAMVPIVDATKIFVVAAVEGQKLRVVAL